MRKSDNWYTKNGKLINGYDYEKQCWVKNGEYVPCNHPKEMNCGCYKKKEEVK